MTGSLGVGTQVIASGAKLDVEGSIYSGTLPTNTVFSGATDAGASFVGYQGYWGIRTDTSHGIDFDVYNSGSPKTALTIQTGGNVGIGTTTPVM